MAQEGVGDSKYSTSHPSSAEETMCITHSIDDPEVDHVTVAQCLIDAQCQCLPSVRPPLPLLSAVPTQQSQGEILPICPFPMQEFLDSHELSVLLSILDPSNDGTFFLDPIILHLWRTACTFNIPHSR